MGREQVTPDMLYPSYPNAARLGSGVPFPEPPSIVPVPAYQQEMGFQAPEMPEQEMQVSPWSLLRGEPNG